MANVNGMQLNMITNILRAIYPQDKQHLNTDMDVIKYVTDMIAARGVLNGEGLMNTRRGIYGEVASQVLFDNYQEDNHVNDEDD